MKMKVKHSIQFASLSIILMMAFQNCGLTEGFKVINANSLIQSSTLSGSTPGSNVPLLPIASPTPIPAPNMACTYYMAVNGSDAGTGSIHSPWASIDSASAKLSPGQTLCARGGTYTGQSGPIWHSSGTPTAPITFRNYPGEMPVFDGEWGDGASHGDFLQFSKNSWILVDGITVQHYVDQYGNGAIELSSSTDIIIQNCTLQDNGSNSNQDHNVYIGASSDNVTVRNNLLIRAAGAGVQAFHTPASKGIKIYNNVIIGGTLNCSKSKSNPCSATATALWGIVIGDATDTQIYNNTIYGEQRGIEFNFGAGAIGPYTLKNNLIINSTEFGLNVSAMYAPYFSSDNNLYNGNKTDVIYANSSWTRAQFAANTANDAHSIDADPAFVNAGSDFHLTANSPAIDKGTILMLFSMDKDWLSRPSGVSYDIGAYEFR